MGEIIFSLFIGGWMVISGLILIYGIEKENKRFNGTVATKKPDAERKVDV